MPDRDGAMTMSEVISAWELEKAQHRLTRKKYRALRNAARNYMYKANMVSKDILEIIMENDDIPEDESDE